MARGMVVGDCPHCGQKYRARQTSDGMIRRCEACGQKFRLEVHHRAGAGCLTKLVVLAAGVVGICWLVKWLNVT